MYSQSQRYLTDANIQNVQDKVEVDSAWSCATDLDISTIHKTAVQQCTSSTSKTKNKGTFESKYATKWYDLSNLTNLIAIRFEEKVNP